MPPEFNFTTAASRTEVAPYISLTVSANLYSADHLDAPAVVTDPAADIKDVYVFVNPDDASELILAMTINPIANSATRFSDAV